MLWLGTQNNELFAPQGGLIKIKKPSQAFLIQFCEGDNMPEVKQAAQFFKSEILPYVWIFTSKKFTITLVPRKHHFKHLIGAQYSSNIILKNLRPEFFYNKALKGEVRTSELTDFEKPDEIVVNSWVFDRIQYFHEIPIMLSNCKEIILYNKQLSSNNSQLSVDYLFFKIDSSNGLYLGVRENDSGEYDFASFFCESKNPQKHKSSQKCYQVDDVRKITQSEYRTSQNCII
ncbi:MAG: hypothetical protein Q7I98_01045 [Erysipelotrichaceae bacterium]|nr:hypothetical protein [Erysipelotrichaceae bacterium]